jgi:hypothetical protein
MPRPRKNPLSPEVVNTSGKKYPTRKISDRLADELIPKLQHSEDFDDPEQNLPQEVLDMPKEFERFTMQQVKYLLAFSQHAQHLWAKQQAGIDEETFLVWKKMDGFSDACHMAKDMAINGLEQTAWKLAREGIELPIVKNGAIVGTRKHFSEVLIKFLLEAHRPDLYRAKAAPAIQAGKAFVVVVPEKKSLEDWTRDAVGDTKIIESSVVEDEKSST